MPADASSQTRPLSTIRHRKASAQPACMCARACLTMRNLAELCVPCRPCLARRVASLCFAARPRSTPAAQLSKRLGSHGRRSRHARVADLPARIRRDVRTHVRMYMSPSGSVRVRRSDGSAAPPVMHSGSVCWSAPLSVAVCEGVCAMPSRARQPRLRTARLRKPKWTRRAISRNGYRSTIRWSWPRVSSLGGRHCPTTSELHGRRISLSSDVVHANVDSARMPQCSSPR